MGQPKSFLFCLGTRPEAIKLASVIKELRKNDKKVYVCSTGQHKELLAPFLDFFDLKVDYKLNVMIPNQSISDLGAKILQKVDKVLLDCRPDLVFVQGDTATTFFSALAAFGKRIPIAHVEAGLRTDNIYSPFPEEGYRRMVSRIASFHFPPTKLAKKKLLEEGIVDQVFVTGSTSIDSLRLVSKELDKESITEKFLSKYSDIDLSKKLVLITVHRRESFGDRMKGICLAIEEIAKQRTDAQIIIPVHLNPQVRETILVMLSNISNIHLLEPLDYLDFIWFMKRSFLILSDSGGVQEEAPFFNCPVLVLRENTERMEGVLSGTSILVGVEKEKIVNETIRLFENKDAYNKISSKENPFGDGFAAKEILKAF